MSDKDESSESRLATLLELQERNLEHSRRAWFRLGAKFATWDALPDATDEERDAVVNKCLETFDKNAPSPRGK